MEVLQLPADKADFCVGISDVLAAIPVREDVKAACEILGLDPLHVANEGRFVAFIPSTQACEVVDLMRSHPQGEGARLIGYVTSEPGPPARPAGGLVTIKSQIGATRILDMLSGEQLPRIC